MHTQTRAAPCRGASWNRRRVTARFEKAARLETLLSRQRVEVAHDDYGTGDCVRLIRDHFELGQLTVTRRVRIDVRVENANVRNRRSHRQTRPPRALLPRQIDSRDVAHWKSAQQGDARVSRVVQVDWLFEVQPPLALHWLDAARDSGGRVDPVHVQLRRELLRDVMTAGADSSFICFLQSENVDGRKQRAARKDARGIGDQLADVLRAPAQIHQSEFASQAAGNEIRAARVTDVV